jgi:hypothetical protein
MEIAAIQISLATRIKQRFPHPGLASAGGNATVLPRETPRMTSILIDDDNIIWEYFQGSWASQVYCGRCAAEDQVIFRQLPDAYNSVFQRQAVLLKKSKVLGKLNMVKHERRLPCPTVFRLKDRRKLCG